MNTGRCKNTYGLHPEPRWLAAGPVVGSVGCHESGNRSGCAVPLIRSSRRRTSGSHGSRCRAARSVRSGQLLRTGRSQSRRSSLPDGRTEALGQNRNVLAPPVPELRPSVQQNQRGAAPMADVVKCNAVGIDMLVIPLPPVHRTYSMVMADDRKLIASSAGSRRCPRRPCRRRCTW
jgi:hypothetical protein